MNNMSRTWRHQWKHKIQEYWKKENAEYAEVKRTMGFEAYINYVRQPKPKDRTFHPPIWADSLHIMDKRKKWIKKMLWHRFRHQWKDILHREDWVRMEKLSTKPDDNAWMLD